MNFNNAYVRDLAWVMASPSILAPSQSVVSSNDSQKYFHTHNDWLFGLDQEPAPLIAALSKNKSHRLGYYFEHLVAFWLQQRLAGDYFASHVRVFDQKRVLGEFDFLFTPVGESQLVQWETAVKFYLQFTHDNGEVLWYGPNAKDRLDIKLGRIFTHQLLLARLPQGKALLKEEGFETVRAQTFFKGYLFYPVGSDWQNSRGLPENLDQDHLKGWWTYANRLELPESAATDRWRILPRLEWLALRTIPDTQNSSLMKREELMDFLSRHFSSSQQSLLIVQLTRDAMGLWQEKSRGFAVSAKWPGNDSGIAKKV